MLSVAIMAAQVVFLKVEQNTSVKITPFFSQTLCLTNIRNLRVLSLRLGPSHVAFWSHLGSQLRALTDPAYSSGN
jgi:hypothetical protein